MFPGMRQRLKVYPCPLEGEASGVVDQYVAQRAWNFAGRGAVRYLLRRFPCAGGPIRMGGELPPSRRTASPNRSQFSTMRSKLKVITSTFAARTRTRENGQFKPAMARQGGIT